MKEIEIKFKDKTGVQGTINQLTERRGIEVVIDEMIETIRRFEPVITEIRIKNVGKWKKQ